MSGNSKQRTVNTAGAGIMNVRLKSSSTYRRSHLQSNRRKEMTDRDLMQQALDALLALRYRSLKDEPDGVITALRDRLAHCDRCGKKMGGEGDIHTCTPPGLNLDPTPISGWGQQSIGMGIPSQPEQEPDPIGDAQDRLIAELAAQPEQEPVAWMFQHGETGRMSFVSNDGMNNPELFLAMNPRYALVCALTTPPAAQRKPLTDEEMWRLWNAEGNDAMNQQEAITFARAIEAAHGIK
jgi:hypothetical protein